MEYGGPAAQKYVAHFLPVLQRDLACEDEPSLRQACAYGVTQIAKLAPDHLRGHCAELVPLLVSVVTRPNARDDDDVVNVLVTENSISALGAIATHVLADQDQSQLLRVWLGQLPLQRSKVSQKQVGKISRSLENRFSLTEITIYPDKSRFHNGLG